MKNIKVTKSKAENSTTYFYANHPRPSHPKWAPEEVVEAHATALRLPTQINPLNKSRMEQIGRLIADDRMKSVWSGLESHAKFFTLRQPNGDKVAWSTSLYFTCSQGLLAADGTPRWPNVKLKGRYARVVTDSRNLSKAIASLKDVELLTVTRFMSTEDVRWLARCLYPTDMPYFPPEWISPEHHLVLRLHGWLPTLPELLLRLSEAASKKIEKCRRNTRPSRGDRDIRLFIRTLYKHFQSNYRKPIVNHVGLIADITSVIFAASVDVDRIKKQLSREKSGI